MVYDSVLHGFPYFSQNDERWSSVPYGSSGRGIGGAGCGPTAMAMILRSYGYDVTPADVAQMFIVAMGGYKTTEGGTCFPYVGRKYGLTVRQTSSISAVTSALRSGIPVVANPHGPCDFTQGGHYIVLCGIDANNNISVNDPNGANYQKCRSRTWTPDYISWCCTQQNPADGFWIISKDGQGSINGNFGGTAKIELPVQFVIEVPSGLGKSYSYETWNREEYGYTAWLYDQKRLIETAKSRGDYSFDSEGYGKVGERYAVAMTSTFGAVGDYVDIYCADGTIYKAVIGDEKSQEYVDWDHDPANKYGHDNGQTIVEFMTNWPATPIHANRPGNGGVTKVVNYGSYFDNPEYASGRTMSSYAASGSGESGQKEITSEQVMELYGEQMAVRQNPLESRRAGEASEIELYIISRDGNIYRPLVEEGIDWETVYSGTPAQLTFTVVKDDNINFYEGDQIAFKYNGAPVFLGYLFKKSRSKDGRISCTAYDQTRYLQNQNSMVYSDKTATEVIEMIAKDFSLSVGSLVDTAEKIPLRVEDNATLFEIIDYALNYTSNKTGVWYTLYDSFGKLTLTKSDDLKTGCVITAENAEGYSYETSINEGTYTRIKRYYDNSETGVKEIYAYDESAKRPYYGVLQLCEKIEDDAVDSFKADAEQQMKRELDEYSDPTRTLDISGVVGDIAVRGGSIVQVALNLGDIALNSEKDGHSYICESVKHHFVYGKHTMDVHLTGGGYRFT